MIFDKLLLGCRRDQLSPDAKSATEKAAGEIRTLPARSTLITEGDTVIASTYLVEGFICRYLDDQRGGFA